LAYMLQGKYAQAEENFLYRFQELGKYTTGYVLVEYVRFALNYVLSGNTTQCRKYLEDAHVFFEQETRPRAKWEYLSQVAEVYRLLGELEPAKTACHQSLEGFLTNAEDPEDLVDVAEVRLVMGKILVDMGAYQDALDYLDKAKTAFEICQHYALGETLLYLGKAYQGLGGAVFLRQVKEHVTQALAEFQRLELRHKEREAEDMLKRLTP
jgi:tetratricopeptide (TPR) repeat protein